MTQQLGMRGLVLLVLVGAVACSKASTPRAQLLVVVGSDQAVPAEIDQVAVKVLGPDGDVALERELSLGTASGQVGLPVSFGIAPIGGDVSRRVTVVAEGRLRGMIRVRTRARTSFAAGRVVRLDLFLSRDCEDDYLRCEAMDQTCRRDGCAEVEIPIAALLDAGPPELPRDAGTGSPDAQADAAADATVDATADAGLPDAAPDAGVTRRDGGTSQGVPCTFAGGGCLPDYTCIESKGARPLCRKPCDDRGDPFDCARAFGFGSTCVHYPATDGGSPKGYYCSVPCDPLAQTGCAPETACDVFPVYVELPDAGSFLMAFSDCRPYGDAGQEETCASGAEIGRECAPGFDCFNTTCRRFCAPADGGRGTCGAGFVCGAVDPIGPDAGRPVGVCYPE